MALYLGSSQKKITLNNKSVALNFFIKNLSVTTKLKSFDNFILKDKNNLCLVSKEGEK